MKTALVNRKLSMYQRFLLTYLVIFLFSFIIISLLFLYTGIDSFQDVVVNTNTTILEEVKSETDDRLRSLENSAHKIGSDPNSTPFQMRRNVPGMHILKMMNNDKQNNRMINEIILYYPDVPWLYSTDGTATVDYVFDQKLNLNKQEQKVLMNRMQTIEANSPKLIHSINIDNKQTSAVIYPIPLNSAHPYAAALYILDNQYFNRITESVFGEYKGSLFVYDSNKELISHTSHEDNLSWSQMKEIDFAHNGLTREYINNEKYSILTSQSDVTDWTFVSATSIGQFFSMVSEAWIKASILLVIIFIAGVMISLLVTKKQYKPFETLKGVLSKPLLTRGSLDNESFAKQINSFEDIYKSIENMRFSQSMLREKVTVQKAWRRDQVLFQLLEGKPIKDKKSLELIPNMMTMSSAMVIKVSFKAIKFNGESLYNYEKLSQIVHEFSVEDYRIYGLELPEKRTFILIATTQTKHSQESLEERQKLSSKVYQLIENNTQLRPLLGGGMFTNSLEKIYLSYLESEVALDKKRDDPTERIALFSKYKAKDTYDFQIGQELLKLQRSLKQGKHVGAKKISSDIILELLRNEKNTVYFKLMCADLANTVLKIAHSLDVPLHESSLTNLYDVSSIQEYEQTLYELIDLISQKVKDDYTNKQKEENHEIITYIQAHYTEVSFGLEQVAEALNISNSHVSKSVKEETKQTFSRFLWHLRKEEVKKQLITTNKAIKDIIVDVGYIDGSNFSRRFKQEEGVTPSEYRNLHSHLVKI